MFETISETTRNFCRTNFVRYSEGNGIVIGFLRRRKHNRLQELLSAYIDGEASNSEVIEVEEHLSGCDECRIELDSLRATVGLLRGLPQFDVPRSFILTEAPALVSQRPPPIVWTARLASSAAALLLLALLLGDAFGILSQTDLLREVSTTIQVELTATPSTASGQPGIPGQVQRSEPSLAIPAPAATALPQPASRAVTAPPTPNPTPQPPVQAAAAPEAPQAAPAPALAAMAPGATPSETPAPEMMVAAAPAAVAESDASISETPVPEMMAAADDTTTVMSAAAVPEAATTPQPLEEKDADVGVVVTPQAAIEEPEEFILLGPVNFATEQESKGISLPLRQLEIAVGALLAVLVLATLWVARRRSTSSR